MIKVMRDFMYQGNSAVTFIGNGKNFKVYRVLLILKLGDYFIHFMWRIG